jgi:hypothetical protein
VARAWLQGEIPERLYAKIVPSVITTGFITWVIVARLRGRARHLPPSSDQFLVIFGVVLVANSVLSYPYTKHEIVSVAGTFYALAAFAVARYAIEHLRTETPQQRSGWADTRRFAIGALLVVLATMWAFRAAGLHYVLQVQAFNERNEWGRLDTEQLADRDYRSDASARALAAQLRRDALELRVSNPRFMPGWATTWWAE